MTGSSSTWYAINARVRTSRSSAARTATLEGAKEVLRVADERLRLLAPQDVLRVDAPPGHSNGVYARGFRGADVERRVADIGRGLRPRVEPVERSQDRVGSRLVPLRVVGGDDDVEVLLQLGQPVEGEPDGGMPLGGDDAEPAALLAQPREHLDHFP